MSRPRSGRAAVVLAVLAALLITAGAVTVLSVARPGCIDVTMFSSDEKADQLRGLAERFRTEGERVDDRCVAVRVDVTGSRATSDALAADPADAWDVEARPDIWSPSSSIWVTRLSAAVAAKVRAGQPARVRGVAEPISLATTPVVIAMPMPMATALGWPDAEIGWRDLLALAADERGWAAKGHPEWGAFKIAKTNPEESTTGLLATIATASALAGGELTAEALPAVAPDLALLERATVHYGRYVETFVGNLYRADRSGEALDYVSAIAMEEKVILDYNQGIILGNPPPAGPPPNVPLAAVFPSDGTMASDNPALVVDAEWVTEPRRRAAEAFLRFVQDNRQVFLDAGFRDAEGRPGPMHRIDLGTVASPRYRPVRTPAIEVIEAVRTLWAQNRRRANVLLVVDVSQSMGTVVESAGRTRLDLAKEAAAVLPQRLAPDDRMGLWEFSSEVGFDELPWRELIPLGPVSVVGDDFAGEIAAMQPIGQTALYATTRAAVEHQRASFDPDRINAVIVLSDGRNQYDADNDLSRLLRDLQPADADRAVRVFTIAYGAEADAQALADISDRSRASSYDAQDATRIREIMLDVLSNF